MLKKIRQFSWNFLKIVIFHWFFTNFLKHSPGSGGLCTPESHLRRPPCKPSPGGPPPRKIPAGANVNNTFFAISLRNLLKFFQNFLKISKDYAFFVQSRKYSMLGFLNFLKNMLRKSIFSIFIKNFLTILWKFYTFFKNILYFLNIFANFLNIFWKFFWKSVSPPPKKNPSYAHVRRVPPLATPLGVKYYTGGFGGGKYYIRKINIGVPPGLGGGTFDLGAGEGYINHCYDSTAQSIIKSG